MTEPAAPSIGKVEPEPAVLTSPSRRHFWPSSEAVALPPSIRLGQPHAVPICYVLLNPQIDTPIDEKPKRGDRASCERIRNILWEPKCLPRGRPL